MSRFVSTSITIQQQEAVAQTELNQILSVVRADTPSGTVTIDFCGSGDEGAVSDVSLTGGKLTPEIEKKLEDWADRIFDLIETDWYNNDGGDGEIEIDIATGKATWEVYYNVTEREHGESGEL
jgi:hypothetical protein